MGEIIVELRYYSGGEGRGLEQPKDVSSMGRAALIRQYLSSKPLDLLSRQERALSSQWKEVQYTRKCQSRRERRQGLYIHEPHVRWALKCAVFE